VKIAKQNLLPGLNLVVGSTIVGDPGSTGLNVDGRRRNITAGADVDLNLNQTPVRNDLVAAQIAEQAARRNLELAEESIRRQIRGAWRALELAKRQYDLALTAVALSESRLQQEEAFSEEGRGTTRDLIDAQQDLIDARDLRTAGVIAHTTARLQLWRDMGILFIKKDGSWMDVLKNEPPRANPTAQPTD
jgi:outer membrane protein TolC